MEKVRHSLRLLVLPPSTYALEFVAVAEEIPGCRVEGFIECEQRERGGQTHADLPIHWIDDIEAFAETHGVACALGTTHRDRYVAEVKRRGLRFRVLRHPSAQISAKTTIEEGSFFDVGCIVASYSQIGRHTRIKRGAIVGHHTKIGNYVTVQPGANVAGHCQIADNAYIGMSAVVLDHLSVGAHSVVGAGAVVTKDVPDNVMVMGVPARIVKENIAGK